MSSKIIKSRSWRLVLALGITAMLGLSACGSNDANAISSASTSLSFGDAQSVGGSVAIESAATSASSAPSVVKTEAEADSAKPSLCTFPIDEISAIAGTPMVDEGWNSLYHCSYSPVGLFLADSAYFNIDLQQHDDESAASWRARADNSVCVTMSFVERSDLGPDGYEEHCTWRDGEQQVSIYLPLANGGYQQIVTLLNLGSQTTPTTAVDLAHSLEAALRAGSPGGSSAPTTSSTGTAVQCPDVDVISELFGTEMFTTPNTQLYLKCDYESSDAKFSIQASDDSQSYDLMRTYLTTPLNTPSASGSILNSFENGNGWSYSAVASQISYQGRTTIIGIGTGLAQSADFTCSVFASAPSVDVIERATRAGLEMAQSWCSDQSLLPRAASVGAPAPPAAQTSGVLPADSPYRLASWDGGPLGSDHIGDGEVFFKSPTGNIVCAIRPSYKDDGQAIVCEVLEHSWTADQRPTTCDAVSSVWGTSLVAMDEAGSHSGACFAADDTHIVPRDAAVLPYGSSVTAGVFSCSVSETGVQCRRSGFTDVGFEVNSAAFSVFGYE